MNDLVWSNMDSIKEPKWAIIFSDCSLCKGTRYFFQFWKFKIPCWRCKGAGGYILAQFELYDNSDKEFDIKFVDGIVELHDRQTSQSR